MALLDWSFSLPLSHRFLLEGEHPAAEAPTRSSVQVHSALIMEVQFLELFMLTVLLKKEARHYTLLFARALSNYLETAVLLGLRLNTLCCFLLHCLVHSIGHLNLLTNAVLRTFLLLAQSTLRKLFHIAKSRLQVCFDH